MSKQNQESIAKAVALRYKSHENAAPKVVAKGLRKIAEGIIAMAREHNIPLREDPDLIEILLKIDIGDEIPEELYQVVAEILAFVYKTNNKWKEMAISGTK